MPDSVSVKEVLETLTFGKQIAEDERDLLATYFVKTDQWRRVFSGDVDIVYGAKGAGKSALYFLLVSNEAKLRDSNILIETAENPRGATAFRDLATEPPASEQEFINLWKLYFLALAATAMKREALIDAEAESLISKLEEISLISPPGGLRGLLHLVREYAKSLSGVQTDVSVDGQTGNPSFSAKILFGLPSTHDRSLGAVSIEELFELADSCLARHGKSLWLLLDRLDVAFAETPELEQNALRALFRTYRDLQAFNNLSLKIFLRTDIWRRITEGGFREASHITKAVTVNWNRSSLLNLIILRSLRNDALRAFYEISDEEVKTIENQLMLFEAMFPEQVDSGPNKPHTLEWLLSRTQDGTRETAPRELIHLLNSLRDIQFRRIEVGEPEPTDQKLFTRTAIKEALPEVSRIRLEQTLYTEYPGLKPYCEKLRGAKTQQSKETLSQLWDVDSEQSLVAARQLVEVGFFEQRGDRENPDFWVPFLYRDALDMVQGTATE